MRSSRPLGRVPAARSLVAILVAAASVSSGLVAPPPAPAAAKATTTPAPPPGPGPEARRPLPVRAGAASPGLPPFAIPDLSGDPAAALAALRERKGMREGNLRVFELDSGGVHIAQLFPVPVHFRNDAGDWVDIDPRIVPVPGGFTTAATPIGATFPQVLTDEGEVVVIVPGGGISARLEGAARAGAKPAAYAVTYADVLAHVDLAYESAASGVRELLTLHSDRAPSSFSWELVTEGVALQARADGSISVVDPAGEVARIPAPYAYDSSPEEAVTAVSSTLEDLGGSRYRLTVEIPRAWLDDPGRTYPVVLDPSTFQSPDDVPFLKDTSVLSDAPESNFATASWLRVGNDGDGSRLSYMTFDIRKEIRKLGEGQLVYSADLKLYATGATGLSNPGATEVHRVTEHWSQWDVTWNNKPAHDGSVLHGSSGGCGETHGGVRVACPGWHTLAIPSLVQYWLDNPAPDDPDCDPAQPDTPECLGSNHGLRLSSPGTTTAKEFSSTEGPAEYVPSIIVVVNSLPSTPLFAPTTPPDGAGIEGTTPTITIEDVTDANGDAIEVNYQFANDRNFTSVVHSSGWLAEGVNHSYTVPGGALEADRTYYYRVQATDAEGTSKGRALPSSEVRRLNTVSKDRGYDARSAMWTQGLGNGITLRVNEATGNLVLSYPIDSIATQAGALDLSLTYNSNAASDGDDEGIGRGWSLGAGPTPRPSQLPVRLEPATTSTAVATVVYRSGRREVYVAGRGQRIYTAVGPLAGVVRKQTSAGAVTGWHFTAATGGSFVFDAAGRLVKARPATSKAAQPGFTYDVDPDTGRLRSVRDPAGRQVSLFKPGATGLEEVTGFGSLWEGRRFTFGYDSSGRLTTITEPFADARAVTFTYNSSGLLASVSDATRHTTTLAYGQAQGQKRPAVTGVLLPGRAHQWRFDYSGPFTGPYAASTSVTDPRGVATTSDGNDYRRIVDFNTMGLPIRDTGPARLVSGEMKWPVTTRSWDANGNLMCVRDPLANGDNPVECLPGGDRLQRELSYQAREPFFLREVLEPAAAADATHRLTTRHRYDEGITGLQTYYYADPISRDSPRPPASARRRRWRSPPARAPRSSAERARTSPSATWARSRRL